MLKMPICVTIKTIILKILAHKLAIILVCSAFAFLILVILLVLLKFGKVDYQSLFKKGVDALENKDFKKAKNLFLKALELSSLSKEAHFKLGLAYFGLNEYKKAKECFEYILEIEPDNFDSLFNLALTFQMEHSYEEAKELYEKIIAQNDQDSDSYYNLGIILFEEQNLEKALELFENADKLSPDKTDIQFSLIRCKDELCKYETKEESQQIIDEYMKIAKNSNLPPKFNISMAKAYAKAGLINQAFERCKKAIVAYNRETEGYKLLGLIQLIKNDLENAKQNLLKAIDLDVSNPEAYNILLYVFSQQDNKNEYKKYKEKYDKLIEKQS